MDPALPGYVQLRPGTPRGAIEPDRDADQDQDQRAPQSRDLARNDIAH